MFGESLCIPYNIEDYNIRYVAIATLKTFFANVIVRGRHTQIRCLLQQHNIVCPYIITLSSMRRSICNLVLVLYNDMMMGHFGRSAQHSNNIIM